WLISPALTTANTSTLSFAYRTKFPGPDLVVKVSTNYSGGDPSLATWTDLVTLTSDESDTWKTQTPIDISAYAGSNTVIAFVYTSSTSGGSARWTIDDFVVTNASVTPPTATLTTSVSSLPDFGQVQNGQVSASQSYTVSGSDLTGDVTITAPANFEVSLDNTNFSSSITLAAGTDFTLPTLNATTIYVRFAPSSGTDGVKTGNITHSSPGAVTVNVAVSGEETGNGPSVVQVANLAELRSKPADGTTVYQVTGEVVLTYQQGFRNQKYVQDNTAGILIDDPGSPGKITTTYNVGDGITGLTGTLSVFGNMLQFVPTADPGAATSTGNAIVPVDITMDDFINNFEQYEARVVRINEEVTFTTSGTFANGQVYDFTNGTLTGQFRTTFYDMDYIGQPVPSTPVIITGILNERSNGKFITARNSADFEIVAPYVYYASTAGTVVEGKSKVVRIDFSEPAASASTIEITLGGPAAEGADYSTTPAAASGVVTLSVNAGDSYAELTVDALDNANNDGDRSATFTITAASGGLKLDPDQAVVYTLTIADDELQVREIAEVQTLDNMGVSIFDGATVEVRGVVHGININQVSGTSLQFALIDTDPLAGLQVLYNGTADLGYAVAEGDSVHVQGVVDNIDGMTVVVPSSIQKIGTGATMNPIELAAGTLLEEKYESQLVRLNKLQVVSGWGEVANGKDYWAVVVTDGNRDYIMRIDNDSDLFGTEAPAYTFSLTGLVMQDDATAPYDEGYQIMPRTAADLEADATTGVDAAFSAQVRVYPNPAAGNWTVDNLRGAWEWTLYNLQGERVAVKKLLVE
uniref:choice-of-anchor J domain-containing protein n=1 Tax=Thermonema rossianum TaxID=55505 RepID=UPI001B800DC6